MSNVSGYLLVIINRAFYLLRNFSDFFFVKKKIWLK